ncbi:MAG: type 2 isopentenyl-diphosphate Delta-isomerase [Bacteroidia bacterium]|nr:type 2 isopentenyl-diphosphate Delta-isomerase [Bacteroidia bacterium]
MELAFESQVSGNDTRFSYEPLMTAHPGENAIPVTDFAGKSLKLPWWVSSMTGGTEKAGTINHNLAKACKEFGMGIGLGSCRSLIDDDTHLKDFTVRKSAGDEVPIFANLGIAQVEILVEQNQTQKITDLVNKLEADGLIVHINPLQEWLQPEGDAIKEAPLVTLHKLIDKFKGKIIVKEVGQGFGPQSIEKLLQLPIEALDFGAHGGTNFAQLELLRDNQLALECLEPLTRIGHTAVEMVSYVNTLLDYKDTLCRNVIISGGIKNFLDGYYLLKSCHANAVYGQASGFLKHAMGNYESLQQYCELQKKGLQAAYTYLTLRGHDTQ